MKPSSGTWRRQFLRLTAIILGSVVGLGVSRLSAQERQPLCDGKTLAGWVQRGGKSKFAIADGVIVGTTVKGAGNSFLCTQHDYGDFILELEIKADPGLNSGVQVRSHCFDEETTYDHGAEQIKIPAGRVHGYQIEVDHRPERRWSGGVYDEARRGWLHAIATNSPASQAFKFGEWNQYRIRCVGGSIQTWINGVPVADLIDTAELSGFIALQVHGADQDGMQVRFRNVRLSDLGAHVWQPVLQGDSLGNSHTLGKGDWKIENGVIHATHSKSDKEYGHLVSDAALTDFTVRMKYKAIQGNSGFYFRIEESGDSGVSGLQAEIDAAKDAGGLYESHGRGWVSRPAPEDVKQWFKPQDWNVMTVTAKGRRIVVEVNGHKTAEVLDDTGRTEGPGALQLHGGQDVDVYFKDIEVLTDRG